MGNSNIVNIKTSMQQNQLGGKTSVSHYPQVNPPDAFNQTGYAASIHSASKLVLLDQSLQRTEDNQLQQIDSDDDYERVKEEVDRATNNNRGGLGSGLGLGLESSPPREEGYRAGKNSRSPQRDVARLSLQMDRDDAILDEEGDQSLLDAGSSVMGLYSAACDVLSSLNKEDKITLRNQQSIQGRSQAK